MKCSRSGTTSTLYSGFGWWSTVGRNEINTLEQLICMKSWNEEFILHQLMAFYHTLESYNQKDRNESS